MCVGVGVGVSVGVGVGVKVEVGVHVGVQVGGISTILRGRGVNVTRVNAGRCGVDETLGAANAVGSVGLNAMKTNATIASAVIPTAAHQGHILGGSAGDLLSCIALLVTLAPAACSCLRSERRPDLACG